jgi:hypothetical protein
MDTFETYHLACEGIVSIQRGGHMITNEEYLIVFGYLPCCKER